MNMIFIRFIEKDQAYSFFISEHPIYIGRSPKCDLTLTDEKISNMHCEMGVTFQGQLYVKDLNSSNGTFINHQKVDLMLMYPGDVLKIGGIDFSIDEKRTAPELLELLKMHQKTKTVAIKKEEITASMPIDTVSRVENEITMSKVDLSGLELNLPKKKKR